MVTKKESVKESESLKYNPLRHAEYYGMQGIFDDLYARSVKGETFDRLMCIILSRENILLAYRNIKGNRGSQTPGTDGQTIRDIEAYTPERMVTKVRNIIENYSPRAVRRKEIPKPNGKTRPLGIPCIWDRLIQQCILQVLEPVCEARFSDNSYGFRPNRSCEHAIAEAMRLINMSKLHFVIEVDIKSFFDEVNHSKLIRQMWAIGIRDKKLIYIIRRILTAPIKMLNGELAKPHKGTPQGGILSPLLANIVLNELDKWVESQWKEHPVVQNYKNRHNRNGSQDKSSAYRGMRKTGLKEMYIVRYADDFRIFCRTQSAANRTRIAVEKRLKRRLRLSVSAEKTRIVNLKRQYSEFLGFKMRVHLKEKKYVVKSHICDKAKERIAAEAKSKLKAIARPKGRIDLFGNIRSYNAFVMGVHNYYQKATHVSMDFGEIAFTINKRLRKLAKKYKCDLDRKNKDAVMEKYGKSRQVRYIIDAPIAPIGYVQTRNPMCCKKSVQKYTPEGREVIHKNLGINTSLMLSLMRLTVYGDSVQLSDNRIALFCAQYGQCALTGQAFMTTGEIHCHHKTPREHGGTDKYSNLMLVHKDVHTLIHATAQDTIALYLNKLELTGEQLMRLNALRVKAKRSTINHVTQRIG
jgi:group II intron reverse transcriptase/maturase